MTAVPDLAAALAATGLAPAIASCSSAADDATWRRLLGRIRQERITGLALRAVDEGVLPLADSQRNALESAHREAMAVSLILERTLLHAVEVLDADGIPVRILKGAAVAHLDYDDPSLRSFGDVDLLVPGERFDAAVSTLAAAGARRVYAELRPGFDRRFGKGALMIAPDGREIDLHRTFVAGPFGLTVDFDALFATRAEFEVGGKQLAALDDIHRFLHACYHAAIGRGTPRLVPLRDVAQMAVFSGIDSTAVLSAARAWQAEAVVALAVRSAWQRLNLSHLTPLSVWAERHQADRAQIRMLSAYSGAGWSFGAQSLAALRIIPGVRDKFAFAYAVARPTRAALRTRGESRLMRWRRGAGVVTRQLRQR